MSTRTRIPIRIRPSVVPRRVPFPNVPLAVDAVPPAVDREEARVRDEKQGAKGTRQEGGGTGQETGSKRQELVEEESLEMWRDRALRLQAEMKNFRKRQQRLADERIAADRERLLRAFLRVADDLERALNVDGASVGSLRQGVGLTYQGLMRLMDQEGVEPIQAKGRPFDPTWHEAVGTVPYQDAGTEPDAVIEVVQPGYRMGDRLLRPARVVVAV